MHDKTHLTAGTSDYCETCGQPIRPAPSYGERSNSNRIGIALSILLHVLLVAYYLLRPEPKRPPPPPTHESAMMYVAPLANKPQPKPPSKQPKQEQAKVKPTPPSRQPRVAAITPPARRKLEVIVPPVVAPVLTPVQEVDMAAHIAAARKRRAEAQPAAEVQESEGERATRVARANIAAAQGKNSGSDKDDSGGVFSIVDKTSHSASIKFRGWNTNFKRRWLTQVQVEQGAELDIETAIVKKMIELIRKEKPGDFVWESHRLGRNVPMSALPEHTAELQAFLLKEFFPEYRLRR
ncbi:hypothetical protein [Janthinobacterium fluminis]|uniref:Uncharacterized protein n=1 Tax=Janthinobacterium fluminis TaxID=2987524 RepID=A0ABT5K5S2_9BURK|nr:hypothetical protein [Janthinobacterium fluminis]MDC8760279.1 hypothetical protein [Janthinobacterium fluminis]